MPCFRLRNHFFYDIISQRPGVDFTEVFSPTFRMASIRTIIALAAKHKYILHSIDISSASLNGELEEEIYMEQPPGFQQLGPDENKGHGSVCK